MNANRATGAKKKTEKNIRMSRNEKKKYICEGKSEWE